MDPFASYAHIDSVQQFWAELDEILDTPSPSRAKPLYQRKAYVGRILDSVFNLCHACFHGNLNSQYNQDYCINRLFQSAVFRSDDGDDDAEPGSQNGDNENAISMHQLAAQHVVAIVQTSTSIAVLLVAYELVLQYGDTFPATYKSIQSSPESPYTTGLRAFLHRLVHQIWAGSYAAQAEAKIGVVYNNSSTVGWSGAKWDPSPSSSSPPHPSSSSADAAHYRIISQEKGLSSSSAANDLLMQISLREKAVRMLYQVCRVQKLQTSHLKAFDELFIHHLFDLVEKTRHHHDEQFNYQLIKLIAAINEQYMVSSCNNSHSHSSSSGNNSHTTTTTTNQSTLNLVLQVLKQRLNASKTFGENLIFMLNRASSSDAEDFCMQLLVLKLLYLLFTTNETACYFYTNDLKVLVDVFIRQLSDLPEESEALRHTYLRVLHPLLTNTQLCSYPYKRPQIRRLLQALVAHPHLRDISAATRRLVDRCLKAEWCIDLDRVGSPNTVVAIVAPVGGGPTQIKSMQSRKIDDGLSAATNPIQQTDSTRATANMIAQTSTDSDPPKNASTDCSELLSSLSPQQDSFPCSSSSSLAPTLDSSPIHVKRPAERNSSLMVPTASHKTREKRIVSLSHPKSNTQSEDSTLRHASQPYSPQPNTPATPPRMNSPASSIDDDRSSEVLSAASSWHAHMAEHTHESKPKLAMAFAPSPPSISPSHSLHERLCHPPRVGSPLFIESATEVVAGSFCSLDQTVQGVTAALPGLHIGSASNGDTESLSNAYRPSEHESPSFEQQNHIRDAKCVSSNPAPAPRRRKPPQPPSMAVSRRAMQVSLSDPDVHHKHQPLSNPIPSQSSGSIDGQPGHLSLDASTAPPTNVPRMYGIAGADTLPASSKTHFNPIMSRENFSRSASNLVVVSSSSSTNNSHSYSCSTGAVSSTQRRRPPPPPPPPSSANSRSSPLPSFHRSTH